MLQMLALPTPTLEPSPSGSRAAELAKADPIVDPAADPIVDPAVGPILDPAVDPAEHLPRTPPEVRFDRVTFTCAPRGVLAPLSKALLSNF